MENHRTTSHIQAPNGRACPCGGTLDRFGNCTRSHEAAARLLDRRTKAAS
jgi:hypothetical protein